MANQEMLDKLRDAIVNQDVAGIKQLTQEALDAGIPAIDIITKGLSVGMKIIGDKFEAAEVFLPQIMMSAKAMNNGEKVILVGSALMTTSMLGQKDLMDMLREENLRDSVKCMFGGAPVSKKWVDEIGADATAENAAEAAKVALEMMK